MTLLLSDVKVHVKYIFKCKNSVELEISNVATHEKLGTTPETNNVPGGEHHLRHKTMTVTYGAGAYTRFGVCIAAPCVCVCVIQ